MFAILDLRRFLFVICAITLSGCGLLPAKEDKKTPTPTPPPTVAPVVKPTPAPRPKPLIGEALINNLLPTTLSDRRGWAADLNTVFDVLKIVPSKENVCAVLAEIGQESSFQTDPEVFGLSKIVRGELNANREKYGIPQWIIDRSLEIKSPNGLSYNERIDKIRTENDLNELYEDMISEIAFGKELLADYNPVQTIGPMQVNLNFAQTYAKTHRYPFFYSGSLRNALVTRKGGLYFGVAYLLDYPANYDDIKYRFADYNSGQYSCRNAAFQNALSSLSGMQLKLDGDLLRYSKDGVALQDDSQSMVALLRIASRLNMSKADIYRNLLLEKTADFEKSMLYTRLYALAPKMPKALMPEIVVNGPKTSGKLTTAVYAKKVYGRYQRCLKQ